MRTPSLPTAPTSAAPPRVTAESVAFVVTAARGMATDAYTLPYVAGWSGGRPDEARAAATTVLATARMILDRLDAVTGPAPTQDEIGNNASIRMVSDVRSTRARGASGVEGRRSSIDRITAHGIPRPVRPCAQ